MKTSLRGVLIWLIVTLFVIYAFFLNTAGAVFGDVIKSYLHLSDLGAALAVGSFILGFATMQIPAGYLLDRFAIRTIVSSGLFVLALGTLTLSFASNLWLFALSNFVQGLGASFAFIAAGKLISQWFAPKLFPIFFGLTQTLSCILTAFIHYYLVKALETISWQVIYQQLAIFGFSLLILTVLFVKSPKKTKAPESISFKKSISTVFSSKQIWIASIAAATSFGALAAYASFWYLNVQKYFLVGVSNALEISGMMFAGIGIGTPLLGWISNKFKSRNLVIHASLTIGAIFLIMCLYLPHFNINTYIPIKATSFLAGFLLSGSMLYYTVVSEISSNGTRALALGLVNTLVFLFNTILLFIPQFFITKDSKQYTTYLWVLPVSVLLSIFLTYFVKETFSKKTGS
jgi:MFS family permease